jgi:hypothetical protein
VPAQVQIALKQKANAPDILLRDVLNQAVRDWLSRRTLQVQSGKAVTYVRAPRHLVEQLVQLDPAVLDQVRTAARIDGVSVRALLFNALVESAAS